MRSEVKIALAGLAFTGALSGCSPDMRGPNRPPIGDEATLGGEHDASVANIQRFGDLVGLEYTDEEIRQAGIGVYMARTEQFIVDPATGTVVQFGPRPLRDREQPRHVDESNIFDEVELEARARAVVAGYSSVDLGPLSLEHSAKTGAGSTRHFFRWVDTGTALPGGMHPYIQVGISGSGEIISYSSTFIQ
jgi:hypothetical protein